MSQEQRRNFDFFRSQPPPEETFKSVLVGALNEFLDGDLEVVRNFLSGCLASISSISSFELSDATRKGQQASSIHHCGSAKRALSPF